MIDIRKILLSTIFVLSAILLYSTFASASWTFSGTVQNSSFTPVASANVSVGSYMPPGTITYVNSTLTADDGSFHLTVTNDSATTMWKVTVLLRKNTTNTYGPVGNVTEVGPILPGLPKFILNSSMFNGSTIYTEPAATLNLSAAYSNNSASNFNYIIMDNALGDHVDMKVDSFVTDPDRKIYVPRNRTYSIMFMKSPDAIADLAVEFPVPPLPYALNNVSSYANSAYMINIRYNMSSGDYSVYGFVFVAGNNTQDRMINFTKATVRLSLSGRVPPQGTLNFGTINISSKNTSVSNIDFPEGAIGYYRLPVLGASAGISHVIQFYGKNQTVCNETAASCYFGAIQNFTITTSNVTKNVTLFPLVGSYDATEGTKVKKFYIYDGDPTAVSAYISDAMMEVKLKNSTTIGTLNFMVTQITNSYFNMFIPSDIVSATVKMFTHKSAPTEKPAPLNSSAVNFSIKGVQMEIPDPTGERVAMAANQVFFKIMRYNDSCNSMLANFDGCKIGNDLNGNFNPLSLLMGGKINLLISVNGSNSMMLFVGVDKMASAPPTNSVIGNQSTQGNSTGDTIGDVWRIGTLAPPIYERVYVKIPYNNSVDETQPIKITLNKLYDNDWAETWDIADYPSGTNIPSDYSDYNTTWFNRTLGGMPCINTSTTPDCYVNYSGNYLIVKFPHFSNSDTTLNGKRSLPLSVEVTSSGQVDAVAASTVVSEKKANWYSIEPSNPVTMEITDGKFRIKQIEIEVRETTMSPKVTVSELSTRPSSVTEPEATAYRYLQIKEENLNESVLKQAKIKFSVEKKWLSDNNFEYDEVKLYRYKNDWTSLPTKRTEIDTDNVYYEATTQGFSYFAIVANKATEAAPEAGETVAEEEQLPSVKESAAQAESTPEKPAKKSLKTKVLLSSLAVTALIIAAGTVLFLKYKNKKKHH